jgi:hypothetical protein
MKTFLVAVATSLSMVASTNADAASYLFEYSGKVTSVGGTVTDGSLLNLNVGDSVAGSFMFVPGTIEPPPGTLSAQYPNTVPSFEFGSTTDAIGNSYFLMNATTGVVNAYKQTNVAGTVYDTHEFMLEGAESSPFSYVSFDALTSLSLADYSQSYFLMNRVDISTAPLRFTEVKVVIQHLVVTNILAVPEMFADLFAKLAGVGPGRSLANKVTKAESYYGAGHVSEACSVLSALALEINAQSGKHLTTSQAASLRGDVAELSSALRCTAN